MAVVSTSQVFNVNELLPSKAVRVKLDYTVNGEYEIDALIQKAELTTVTAGFFNVATLKFETVTIGIKDVIDGDKAITLMIVPVVTP